MKRFRASALLLALASIAMLVVAVGGAAGAQTTRAQLAFVNGTSTDPMPATASGPEEVTVDPMEFAAASAPVAVESGDYVVTFGDGSTVSGPVAAATASTVVSGYGVDGATAFAYPVTLAPIPEGNAVVAVWNATTADADITVGEDTFTTAPGQQATVLTVAAGTTVAVSVGGVSVQVTPAADNYIDVFAVNDGATYGVAQAVVPSMNALLEAIEPPPPEPVPVPDVVGKTAEEGTADLVNAGFNVAEAAQETVDAEPGTIIGQDPAAGTAAPPGSTVTITVATAPSTIPVPDVTGQPADDAVAELEALGFATTVEEQSSQDVEAGLVIDTNPKAGTEVAPGTNVTVVVSSGPEDVIVPSFLGLTTEEAQALAEDVGLTLSVTEDPDEPDPEGIVVEQEPAEGETVPAGSEVTVLLSPATQDAWSSIKLDPDRVMTAAGINFQPESVSEVSILGTSLSAKDVVDASGYWLVTIDTNSLDPNIAYDVLITGTAEDGSAYEGTFVLPPPGETVDEPQEDEGVPAWVWISIAILLGAGVVIGVLLVMGVIGGGGDAAAEETSTDDLPEPPPTE